METKRCRRGTRHGARPHTVLRLSGGGRGVATGLALNSKEQKGGSRKYSPAPSQGLKAAASCSNQQREHVASCPPRRTGLTHLYCNWRSAGAAPAPAVLLWTAPRPFCTPALPGGLTGGGWKGRQLKPKPPVKVTVWYRHFGSRTEKGVVSHPRGSCTAAGRKASRTQSTLDAFGTEGG